MPGDRGALRPFCGTVPGASGGEWGEMASLSPGIISVLVISSLYAGIIFWLSMARYGALGKGESLMEDNLQKE